MTETAKAPRVDAVENCDECPFSFLDVGIGKSFMCLHPVMENVKPYKRIKYDVGKEAAPADCPLGADPVLVTLAARR